MNKNAVSMSAIKALLASAGRGTKAFGGGVSSGADDIINTVTGHELGAVPEALKGKSRVAHMAGRLMVPGSLAVGAGAGITKLMTTKPAVSKEESYLDKLRKVHPYSPGDPVHGLNSPSRPGYLFGGAKTAHAQGFMDKAAIDRNSRLWDYLAIPAPVLGSATLGAIRGEKGDRLAGGAKGVVGSVGGGVVGAGVGAVTGVSLAALIARLISRGKVKLPPNEAINALLGIASGGVGGAYAGAAVGSAEGLHAMTAKKPQPPVDSIPEELKTAHVQGYIDKCAELGVDAEKLAQAISAGTGPNANGTGPIVTGQSAAERQADAKAMTAAGKKKTYTNDQIAGNWDKARTTAAINRMAAK